MTKTKIADITIDNKLLDFVNNEVIPGLDIDKIEFWNKFSEAANDLSVLNANLIKRERLFKTRLMIGIKEIKILTILITKNF